MKLSELLVLLNKAKDELGEDIEVKCFDGYNYTAPVDEDSYADILDVIATGVKSYKNKKQSIGADTTLYIQWGE